MKEEKRKTSRIPLGTIRSTPFRNLWAASEKFPRTFVTLKIENVPVRPNLIYSFLWCSYTVSLPPP